MAPECSISIFTLSTISCAGHQTKNVEASAAPMFVCQEGLVKLYNKSKIRTRQGLFLLID